MSFVDNMLLVLMHIVHTINYSLCYICQRNTSSHVLDFSQPQLVFLSGFLVSETSHTSVVLTSCTSLSSFIHPFTRTYMFWLSVQAPRGEGYCDTAVRTQCVLHVTSPVSLLTQTPAIKKWPAFKVLTCGDFWDFSSAKLTRNTRNLLKLRHEQNQLWNISSFAL
jgi:hypothetical protein